MSKKRRLGRGLGALINEADNDSVTFSLEKTGETPRPSAEQSVALADIVTNRFQPREEFSAEKIEELAASIEAQGLIQPGVVNDRGDGSFELISGERRLRAVKSLGWRTIPVVIRQVSGANDLQAGAILGHLLVYPDLDVGRRKIRIVHQSDSVQIAKLRPHNASGKRSKLDLIAKLEWPPPGVNFKPHTYSGDEQLLAYLTYNRVSEGISNQRTTLGMDFKLLVGNEEYSPLPHDV